MKNKRSTRRELLAKSYTWSAVMLLSAFTVLIGILALVNIYRPLEWFVNPSWPF